MELRLCPKKYHRVGRGQTLAEIALVYRVPPRLLAAVNSLKEPPAEGQILLLPAADGNLYRVRGGESKAKLCGSAERFEQNNGTRCLYPGQIVLI